jgi:hypothetical protein
MSDAVTRSDRNGAAGVALQKYHVFLMSPGDMQEERDFVRKFFDDYNRDHAAPLRYEVISGDTDTTTGIGDRQMLTIEQTLEKHKESLILMIGILVLLCQKSRKVQCYQ